jgi:hypothetical protein
MAKKEQQYCASASTERQITMHEFRNDDTRPDKCIDCGHPKEYFRHGDTPGETFPEGNPVAQSVEITRWLRDLFPHGHKDYISMAIREMELHSKKNFDYASGGDALGNFKRVANILSNYPGLKTTGPQEPAVVALTYALKQLDQVLWSLSRGWAGEVEGMEDRLMDISVYAKLAIILLREPTEDK